MTRRDNPHLAFGSGPHLCVGAPLARLHTRLALGALFDRFPTLALREQPRWQGVIPFRGLEALHVTW